jgi:hypothetical protein
MQPIRLLLLPALWVAGALTAGAAALRVEPSSEPNAWTVFRGPQKLLVYAFNPAKPKPYVKELCTLKGDNILRDSPPDHLHHHALMYGIKVNGLNFWEETPGCGVQRVVETSKPELGAGVGGLPQVRLTQVLHWVAPQDAFLPDTTRAALLLERRTLTLIINDAQQEVALQWKAEFQVGTKTNEVTLTGAKYHGLGLRFLNELDPLAHHLNSGGKPDLTGNKQDVSQHKWGSISFDAPGKLATLVLFGHPANPRGDAHYFTMRTPFAYLAATQELDREPLVYRAGDKFELNYLITLYAERKTTEAISQRGQQWTSSKP